MKQISILLTLVALFASVSGCIVPTPTPSIEFTPTSVPALPSTPTQPAAVTPTTPPVDTPAPTGTVTVVGIPTPTASALPATPTTPAITETPASGALDLNLLKNFTYVVDSVTTPVILKNGEFNGDHVNTLLVEPAAFGDLNGDGLQDAAVTLATNTGGSGRFYDLVVLLGQNGAPPVQSGYYDFGDRQVVKDLQIQDGRVVMDYLTQGLSDASCCPSEHRLRSYMLDSGQIRLASEQVLVSPDEKAAPLPDAIFIDQPAMLGFLTTPLHVAGRVSQVPPEKKLEYDVTDLKATLLMQGEVTLVGEVGGPGTFSFDVELGKLDPGIIKVEVIDSANGILRGRSMVDLVTPP